MKSLADMGISARTVAHLHERGHDSVHLRDEHMQRSGDAAVSHTAFREGRLLLTCDLDFGDLMAASKGVLPGVVIFRLHDRRPDHVNTHLDNVIVRHATDLAIGAIISVNEKRIRVRRLPIQ